MINIRYDCHDWDTDGYPGEFVHGDNIYVDDYYTDEKWKPLDAMRKYYISDKGRVWSSVSQQANVWKVLNGMRKHTCGYAFEYIRKEK